MHSMSGLSSQYQIFTNKWFLSGWYQSHLHYFRGIVSLSILKVAIIVQSDDWMSVPHFFRWSMLSFFSLAPLARCRPMNSRHQRRTRPSWNSGLHAPRSFGTRGSMWPLRGLEVLEMGWQKIYFLACLSIYLSESTDLSIGFFFRWLLYLLNSVSIDLSIARKCKAGLWKDFGAA